MKLNSLYLTRDLWVYTKFSTNNIILVLVRLLSREFIIFFSFDIKTVNTLNSSFRQSFIHLIFSFQNICFSFFFKVELNLTLKEMHVSCIRSVADVAKNNDANLKKNMKKKYHLRFVSI